MSDRFLTSLEALLGNDRLETLIKGEGVSLTADEHAELRQIINKQMVWPGLAHMSQPAKFAAMKVLQLFLASRALSPH